MARENKSVIGNTNAATAGFIALGCVGFIASTPAMAQDEPTRLEGVTVTDSAVEEGYKVEAISSPKATASILDTPRSVSVITSDVLADTASYSFEDALRTVPGITLGAGEGGTASADIPLIRGVDATGDVFVDGLRDIGSQTRETFAVEQVEVFKGSNSAFGGRGAAAGAINIVSKLARRGNFANATATVGTDDFKRIQVDVNQQLDENVAFRIAGMWHDADTPGRDAVYSKRWGVAPSIAAYLGEGTRLTLAYYHYETDGIPDYGVPLTSRYQLDPEVRDLRVPADADYDNFYGLLARDFQETSTDSATAQFEHDFGGGWVLSNTARFTRSTNDYIVTNPDDSAGNVVNGEVWRATKSRGSENKSFGDNLNLSGVFETGGIGHSLSFGAEYTWADSSNANYSVDTGDRSCPDIEFDNFNCTSLANPDPTDPWNGTITRSDTPSKASAEDFSIYAFDTITIIPQLLLNGGVRWTSYSGEGSGSGRGGPYSEAYSDDFWTWQAGVVFKPTETTSIYASYADSKTPPGTTVGEGAENIGSNTNPAQLPQGYKNWEIGAKAELFDGSLLLSGAVFRIERDNVLVLEDGDTVIDSFEAARLEGFEVGASGRVGPASLFVGYAYVDSEITEAAAGNEDSLGLGLPQTPKHTFSGTVSIEVGPQFRFGGGAYHASGRAADGGGLTTADGYWRFDLNATYDFSDHVGVRVNVQNVGDERYIKKLRNPHFAVPAEARQALASLILRY